MNMLDILWAKTPGFFKRTLKKEESDTWKLWNSIGPILDSAKNNVFSVRRAALIATAEGDELDKHGRDRRMSRYAGESDDDYRNRLMAAYDLYREGGTEPGMQKVLAQLEYPDAEVYPLYKEKYQANPNPEYLGKWSQFLIKIPITARAFMPNHLKALRLVIASSKPAESKLYALLLSMVGMKQATNRLNLGRTLAIQARASYPDGLITMNGSRYMNGSWSMDSRRAELGIVETM